MDVEIWYKSFRDFWFTVIYKEGYEACSRLAVGHWGSLNKDLRCCETRYFKSKVFALGITCLG
jgi:hypothetical protein